MCSNPQTNQQGQTYACKRCNACLTARKNDWIARACAHKSTVRWAGVLNLTYHDHGKGYDGARQYRYKDVADMFKRLRQRINRRRKREQGESYEPVTIEYLVCGERGSDYNRVHWHIILYSDENLYDTGQWADFLQQWNAGYKPSDGPKQQYLVDPQPDRAHQKIWDLWPYGLVTIDKADEAGIEYVLKYILKDQFSAQASKGTLRQTKSENAASTHFVKTPSIGLRWLIQRLAEWRHDERVPTSLNLNVPGYSGYWWPKGIYREYLIEGIRIINDEINHKHGRNAPQWTTLLSTLETPSLKKDKDRILGIEEYNEYAPQELEKDAEELQKNIRRQQLFSEQASVRAKCGGIHPCQLCFDHFEPETYIFYRVWHSAEARRLAGKYEIPRPTEENWHSYYELDRAFRSEKNVNPFCQQQHKKRSKYIYGSAFPRIREKERIIQGYRARGKKSKFVGPNAPEKM